MANYLPSTFAALQKDTKNSAAPIYIAGFGSSVGVGATLPDANSQSAVSTLTAQLRQALAPAGNFNLVASNQSVNGSIVAQFPAAWASMQAALAGVSVDKPGVGYSVGDFLTVNQGNSPSGGVVVTSVGSGGSITGLQISSYTNTITEADRGTPTTGGYTVATNVPVINGPTSVLSVAEQTGTGSGATVDITQVGVLPTAVVFAYGMNDGQVAQYNAGETFTGYTQSLQQAVKTVKNSGADCILLTSPHPSVVAYASTLYAMPPGVPQYFPSYVPTPVDPTQIVPPAADSNVTQDFLFNGTPITMSYRFLQINQIMRSIASENGCLLLDAEPEWMAAIQQYQIATGSATGAEATLFATGQFVHPNLLGQQLSYGKAITAFINKVITQ